MNVITRYDFANSRYILRISANKNDLNISEQEWIEYLRIRNEYDKMQKWIKELMKNEVNDE